MPLPTIDGVVRVAMIWTTTSGAHPVNVMHFRLGGEDLEEFADDFESNWDIGLMNFTSSICTIESVVYTDLSGIDASLEHAWTGDQPDAGGDPSPASAVLIKMTTAKRGRSYRGRLYMPWPSETFIGGGFTDATRRGNCTTAWQLFASTMAGVDKNLVVASYKLSTAEDVTTVVCESALGTMRRRQSVLRT